MSTALTRMGRNGRVVIPKRLRDKLWLKAGESLLISDVDGRIVLASVRGESIQQEFQKFAQEFDRQLAGQKPDVDPVDLIRRLRDEGAQDH